MSATVEEHEVRFLSGGVACAGYLALPRSSSQRLPCVVLANGFSGTMDWLLPAYAKRFADAGFAALRFDYRSFGKSEGRPRQLVSVANQREDIRAALQFVRGHRCVDSARIALWGTSLGGGHVIALAAEDPSLAAVIAQVPGVDMVAKRARALIKVPASQILRLLGAAVVDQFRGLVGLTPYYAKIFGGSNEAAVFTDPALVPRFEALRNGSPTWRNEFTPRFYLALPRYQAGSAERIMAPLLVCIADREVYGNPSFQEWVAKQAPRGEVKRYNGDHFDFYHDLFEQVVVDELSFLEKHFGAEMARR
jgi:pimeloyl-ACP methyl ester carboxylesterase